MKVVILLGIAVLIVVAWAATAAGLDRTGTSDEAAAIASAVAFVIRRAAAWLWPS